METERTIQKAGALARKLLAASVGLFGLGLTGLLATTLAPIQDADSAQTGQGIAGHPVVPSGGRNIESLMASIAERPLIRAPQVQAAVKDSGAAARLAKMLKFQGVVNMGGESVAYINVDKSGVKSVRKGQKILEFVVERIESGGVVLSLDGVEVNLGY